MEIIEIKQRSVVDPAASLIYYSSRSDLHCRETCKLYSSKSSDHGGVDDKRGIRLSIRALPILTPPLMLVLDFWKLSKWPIKMLVMHVLNYKISMCHVPWNLIISRAAYGVPSTENSPAIIFIRSKHRTIGPQLSSLEILSVLREEDIKFVFNTNVLSFSCLSYKINCSLIPNMEEWKGKFLLNLASLGSGPCHLQKILEGETIKLINTTFYSDSQQAFGKEIKHKLEMSMCKGNNIAQCSRNKLKSKHIYMVRLLAIKRSEGLKVMTED